MNKHELYHNHNYVYLLTSNIINRCGDSLDTILFTWLVYLITNHPEHPGRADSAEMSPAFSGKISTEDPQYKQGSRPASLA